MTKKTFKNPVSTIAPLAKCMAALALIHAGAANATVISAESNAYALGVDLDVSTLVSVDVAVPQAGGTAPGSYFDVSSVVLVAFKHSFQFFVNLGWISRQDFNHFVGNIIRRNV